MGFPIWLHPTAAGLSFAAAAVAAGGPIFSDGLRALRLRRMLPRLREVALARTASGMAHARGTVVLESPLFSPLSRVPCAGFQLEVRGAGTPMARAIDVFRPFRISSGGVTARVDGGKLRWLLSETATREVAPDQPLTQNLEALLERVPEALWLRRSRVTLCLTERALLEGVECHVVGHVRDAHETVLAERLDVARTGTDDALQISVANGAARDRAISGPRARTRTAYSAAPAYDLRIDPGDPLGYLLISDRPPEPRHLVVPAIRIAGVALGPLLSLSGLLYLALAVDLLRASVGR
jgi:hypothetical protein